MAAFKFNPPTENTGSPIALDVNPLANRLMRHFTAPRPVGRAIWWLADDTLSWNQPFPTIEDTVANRASLFPVTPTPPSGLGTSTSNLTAITYKKLYSGGHEHVIADQAEYDRIYAFLVAEGYNPLDWLTPA